MITAQERAWDRAGHDWERSAHNLRSLLTEKHVSASDRRARFVGVDAYVAAGGTLERDLFDEQDEGYLTDPALLDRLAAERSASLVADLRHMGVKPIGVCQSKIRTFDVTIGARQLGTPQDGVLPK